MNTGKFGKYKSWLTSAGIALAIAVWLMSGQVTENGGTDQATARPDHQRHGADADRPGGQGISTWPGTLP